MASSAGVGWLTGQGTRRGVEPLRAGWPSRWLQAQPAFRRRGERPYGYTITIWSSGAVGMDLLGKPHVDAALLYVAGAVAAFLAVELLAYGQLRVRLSAGPAPRMAVWGNAHLASAGGAVVAVWGADHAFRGELGGWPVAGFLATSVYLLLNAVQTTLASDTYAGGEPTGAPES